MQTLQPEPPQPPLNKETSAWELARPRALAGGSRLAEVFGEPSQGLLGLWG